MHAIARLQDMGVGNDEVAGGKGANLGELTAAGLPVPAGVVVTSDINQPDLLRLETDVLGGVGAPTHDLRLMIPFVRTAWEQERCLEIINAHPTACTLTRCSARRGPARAQGGNSAAPPNQRA